MKCPQGHTNPKTARFCGDCGAKLVTSNLTRIVLAVVLVSLAIVVSYFRAWMIFVFIGLAYVPLLGVWLVLSIKEWMHETPTKTDHVHKGRE